MATGDMPVFASSARNFTNYDTAAMAVGMIHNQSHPADDLIKQEFLRRGKQNPVLMAKFDLLEETGTMVNAPISRRLVQVIVSDPNPSVPLDACILYRGDEKVTDSDDQELYFELDIKAMLVSHNEKRITFTDKSVKLTDREVKLEPARIRDLKMTVVTVTIL